MQGTPIGKLGENVDLGTPSAPPFMDTGNVHVSEAGNEKSIDSQYKESELGFSGDKIFSEQSKKSVKTETEVVGQRYDERKAIRCVDLFILLVPSSDSHFL